MSNACHLFSIADHVVSICFSPSKSNSMNLLPSFSPFTLDATDKTPLLKLDVDDTLRPRKDSTLVRTFDTGNGDTVVYQLPDGGYQFIIRDIKDRDCCLLIANTDFSECHCALNGDWTMRSFGLNDALMLAYAFAGSHQQTLLIHASCVAYKGLGYPFIAESGTGKSTHSSLWMKHIEDVELLNDDNPIIRIIDGTPYIYGSPWSGKTPCYRNIEAPIGAFVQLKQAPYNKICRQSVIESFASLLTSCSVMKWDAHVYRGVCDGVTRMIETVPTYLLENLPDEDAVRLSYETVKR